MTVSLGTEWLVDAHGCDPEALRSRLTLESFFERVVRELGLRTPRLSRCGTCSPIQGGITGLVLLAESHLACHTFPERGFAAFNLYCCRPVADYPWADRLAEAVGARQVKVRLLERGEA